MTNQNATASSESITILLVDGDATIRHARQLMLRSERYDVRSYATCAALLADPRSRHCSCIVVDAQMAEMDGIGLMREMRATGWRGKGILLEDGPPGSPLMHDAQRHGDKVLARTIADGPLMAAIGASIDHSWTGWNAGA